MSRALHLERHLVERIGWLRAAVLGANDGIVSTASLIVGVAAGRPPHPVDHALLAATPHMPRCAGIAIGIDRLVMVLTGAEHIREVQVH